MYAFVSTADEGPRYIGEVSETLFAGRPIVQIVCPATSMHLAHTILVDASSVRVIRLCPDAPLMQAMAEWDSANHFGGNEAQLFRIVTGRYPWTCGDDEDEAEPTANPGSGMAGAPGAAYGFAPGAQVGGQTPDQERPALTYAELYVQGAPAPYLGRLDPTALERADAYSRFLRLELAGTGQPFYVPLMNVQRCQLLNEAEYHTRVAAQEQQASGAATAPGGMPARSATSRRS